MQVSETKKITDLRWLNLFRRRWENRGQTGEWIFASRKEEPKSGKEMPEADAVIIVPIHVQKNPANHVETRRLVVLREFRIPLGDYEYGFPAGIKMPGEAVIDCAKRELKEETGLQLTVIKRVSPPIYSSTGLTDESVVMVFAECQGEVSDTGLDATEELTVNLLDIQQVSLLCCNHHMKQSSKLWPVLMMFSLLGKMELP